MDGRRWVGGQFEYLIRLPWFFFQGKEKNGIWPVKKKEEEERLQENRHYGRNRRVRGMAAVNRMGRNEGMYACGRQVGGDGQERAKIRTLEIAWQKWFLVGSNFCRQWRRNASAESNLDFDGGEVRRACPWKAAISFHFLWKASKFENFLLKCHFASHSTLQNDQIRKYLSFFLQKCHFSSIFPKKWPTRRFSSMFPSKWSFFFHFSFKNANSLRFFH